MNKKQKKMKTLSKLSDFFKVKRKCQIIVSTRINNYFRMRVLLFVKINKGAKPPYESKKVLRGSAPQLLISTKLYHPQDSQLYRWHTSL
jgi:hypothetical protein